MHCLTLEVRCEWALTIGSIQKGLVSVCTESTRQHTDVPEDALPRSYGQLIKQSKPSPYLKWLVENVGHFVLNTSVRQGEKRQRGAAVPQSSARPPED